MALLWDAFSLIRASRIHEKISHSYHYHSPKYTSNARYIVITWRKSTGFHKNISGDKSFVPRALSTFTEVMFLLVYKGIELSFLTKPSHGRVVSSNSSRKTKCEHLFGDCRR